MDDFCSLEGGGGRGEGVRGGRGELGLVFDRIKCGCLKGKVF